MGHSAQDAVIPSIEMGHGQTALAQQAQQGSAKRAPRATERITPGRTARQTRTNQVKVGSKVTSPMASAIAGMIPIGPSLTTAVAIYLRSRSIPCHPHGKHGSSERHM